MRNRVRRLFPLRYWMLIAVCVGVPQFLEFDSRGKVRDWGLINPWSLSQIGLVLGSAAILFLLTFGGNKAIHQRSIRFYRKFWVAIIALLIISSAVSPADNIVYSIYRIGEWLLVYALLASAYTRAPVEDAVSLLRDVTMWVVNISIAAVLAVGAILPKLAVVAPADAGAGTEHRLGGYLVQPNRLAVIAAVGFLYALIYLRGGKRLVAFTVYGGVLFLTFSRGGMAALVAALVVYTIASKKKSVRMVGLIAILGAFVTALFAAGKIQDVLERGQGMQGFTTLSGRVLVWITAVHAFRERPLLGYGFIDGVKQVLSQTFPDPYWTPPHCHDEFLQALVSGGIVLGVMIAGLYIFVIYRYLKLYLQDGGEDLLFFALMFLQVVVYAVLTPVLLMQMLQPGAFFLICCFACFDALPAALRLRHNLRQAAAAVV